MTNRQSIYYWKCDRPSAFFALHPAGGAPEKDALERPLRRFLEKHFHDADFHLRPAGGQGNHVTYLATHQGTTYFLRLENGPERDDYMEVEAHVLDEVRRTGVPTPRVYFVDASRQKLPFAIQLMERIDSPDLNTLYKSGNLDLLRTAGEIGENLARWQTLSPDGYGPFNPQTLRRENRLLGLHRTYRDYFLLNWEKHLRFLAERHFLTGKETTDLRRVVDQYADYLELEKGCLVHKDLALWNILGNQQEIKAFIDWDDAVAGDPTDDLSLLACFHSGDVIAAALRGYEKVRPRPTDFEPRFWLHLLRNMIVKAVIRVGAGYFDRNDDFFLLGAGVTGQSLKVLTAERIRTAYRGLRNELTMADI